MKANSKKMLCLMLAIVLCVTAMPLPVLATGDPLLGRLLPHRRHPARLKHPHRSLQRQLRPGLRQARGTLMNLILPRIPRNRLNLHFPMI